LTCPVTDYISRNTPGGNIFIAKMFQGFPEIKEALISNRMQAGFLVAPMAIALRSQGVPIKIIYLGHRYGSAAVVHKDGPIRTPNDLAGRTIAIPSRFSDERLITDLVLRKHGLSEKDVHMVEMSPPDVASALAAKAVDMFVMGEPYPKSTGLTTCPAYSWSDRTSSIAGLPPCNC
jgi:NitT/TauT family transport system substrate-binding protein